MPKRAYVSPLLRAMQTFEYALGRDPEYNPEHGRDRALEKVIVRPENSYILNKLRERETGNCADITIDEYVSRSKKPPKAGPDGRDEFYMEDDKKVQERAARLHDEIFRMDDSDCVVRVTHSLLIQNNLIGLEDGGGTVLQKFMLAEGGLFAYVVEGKRTNETDAKKRRVAAKLDTVAQRKEKIEKRMGQRRESAFKNLKAPGAAITPASPPVTIEPAILAM